MEAKDTAAESLNHLSQRLATCHDPSNAARTMSNPRGALLQINANVVLRGRKSIGKHGVADADHLSPLRSSSRRPQVGQTDFCDAALNRLTGILIESQSHLIADGD